MDVQSAANLNIPEGSVRNIHDKDKRLLWSAVGYNVRYDGDTTQQTYTGKNKIFLAPLTTTASDINWVVTKDTISASGTASSNWSIPRGFAAFATPLPAGSYVFSIPSAIDKAFQLNMRDSNDTTYDYTIQAGNTYVSFTTSYDAKSFRFALKAGQGVETNVTMENKLQLEAGSTATAYEPYVGGIPSPSPDYPQDVNVVKGVQDVKVTGKNLVCVNNGGSNHGITYTVNGDGSLTMSGLSDGVSAYKITKVADYMHLKAGQVYTVSANNSVTNNDVTIRLTWSNGTVFNYGVKLNETNKTFTFTSSTDAEVSVEMRVSSGTNLSSGFIVKPQVELGNQSTTWELYQGQTFPVDLGSTELCKIGDYQDYIYKSGNDWYKYAEIGKLVFNGSENWVISNSGTVNFYYSLNNLNLGFTQNSLDLVSNYGSPGEVGNTNTEQGIIIVPSGSNNRLRIRYGTEMTVANWQSKLSTTNMVLYYVLKTSTYTKITDNTLIGQLNAIHDWLTRYDYYGTATGNLPIIINRTGLT